MVAPELPVASCQLPVKWARLHWQLTTGNWQPTKKPLPIKKRLRVRAGQHLLISPGECHRLASVGQELAPLRWLAPPPVAVASSGLNPQPLWIRDESSVVGDFVAAREDHVKTKAAKTGPKPPISRAFCHTRR